MKLLLISDVEAVDLVVTSLSPLSCQWDGHEDRVEGDGHGRCQEGDADEWRDEQGQRVDATATA